MSFVLCYSEFYKKSVIFSYDFSHNILVHKCLILSFQESEKEETSKTVKHWNFRIGSLRIAPSKG